MYILGGSAVAGFSWLKLSGWLTRSVLSHWVGIHSAHGGLDFRMYLEGRPPVTNLYSSAVFGGWGAVMLGWILERIYRNVLVALLLVVGYATLIIANPSRRKAIPCK